MLDIKADGAAIKGSVALDSPLRAIPAESGSISAFTAPSCSVALRASLVERGRRIGDFEETIAAQALALKSVLVCDRQRSPLLPH